jgi:hypothetical protein
VLYRFLFLLLQGESGSQVNLVIPWLAPADQAKVFPNNLKFDAPADQEKYVREWAAKRTGFDCNFKVSMLAVVALLWLQMNSARPLVRDLANISGCPMYLLAGHLLPWAICQGERQHPACGRPHTVHPSRRGALPAFLAAASPAMLSGRTACRVHTRRVYRTRAGCLQQWKGRLTSSSCACRLMSQCLRSRST